jgi:hypothetical protein
MDLFSPFLSLTTPQVSTEARYRSYPQLDAPVIMHIPQAQQPRLSIEFDAMSTPALSTASPRFSSIPLNTVWLALANPSTQQRRILLTISLESGGAQGVTTVMIERSSKLRA